MNADLCAERQVAKALDEGICVQVNLGEGEEICWHTKALQSGDLV